MAKWRFVCNRYPEYNFVGVGQFKNGVLELDDDEKAAVILNHPQFGGIFFLQDSKGRLHGSFESYITAEERIKNAAKGVSDEEIDEGEEGKKA